MICHSDRAGSCPQRPTSARFFLWALGFALALTALAACRENAAGGALADGELNLRELETSLSNYEKGDSSLIPFERLRNSLPDKILGMPRTHQEGQTTKILGVGLSSAQATYADDDRTIEISMTDTGGFGKSMLSLADWTEFEVNKESDDGYERSIVIDGQKGFERYSKSSRSGELAVMAGNRLVITLKGTGVGPDDLRQALRRIRLQL